MPSPKIIKNSSKILEARKDMFTQFLVEARCLETLVGFRGASSPQIVFWRQDLKVWVSFNWFGPTPKRYWIGWGVDSPLKGSVDIVCETNMAVQGYNPRLGSAFAEIYGNTYLLHHGNIGGGRAGIGKSTFWEHFQGPSTELDNGKEVALVGRVTDRSFCQSVKEFVHEVARIKKIAAKRS